MVALVPEDFDHPAREVVPTEEVALEDLPEEPDGHILGCTSHTVRAVVEKRVKGPPGGVQDLLQPAFYGFGLRVVDQWALVAFGLHPLAVLLLATRRKHPPPVLLESLRGIQAYAGAASGDEDGSVRPHRARAPSL